MVNCKAVIEDSSPEMMVNLGLIEYFNYATSDKSDEAILKRNTDNMQCFCDDLVDKLGFFKAKDKQFNINIFNQHVQGKVCQDYLEASIFIRVTSVAIPLMIIIFNVVLKNVAIICVRWLKFENKTYEISIIQSAVFSLLFFNSAIALLLINTNIPGLNHNGILFNGMYSDFSDDWYDKVSQFFVSPMFAEFFASFTLIAPDFLIQKLLALLDRNFTQMKHHKTKCKMAYDYADLNSGAEHFLFEKYPRLLNIVFVSTFYGFGLPILPIIILIALCLSYTLDKLFVMFYHRKPPLYDDTLNKVAIQFLKWA